MKRLGLCCILLILPAAFVSLPAAAQTNPPPGGGTPIAAATPAPDTVPMATGAALLDQGSSLLRTLGGLGLIISLILGGYFAVRRFAPQYISRHQSQRILHLLETLPMGERRSVSIIEVEDQRFLVGNTPHQITFLAALSGRNPLASVPRAGALEDAGNGLHGAGDTFRNLYNFQRGTGRAGSKSIPPDLRAKMRQLRESLEH